MNGEEVLVGTGAVTFAVTGSLQIIDTDFLDDLDVKGTAGTGTLTADCATAHLSIPFTVLDASLVYSLSLSPTQQQAATGATAYVTAYVESNGTLVYAGGCTWTTSSSNLTVTDPAPIALAATDLADPLAHPYNFVASKSGAYTATCTLFNGVSQVAQLTFN